MSSVKMKSLTCDLPVISHPFWRRRWRYVFTSTSTSKMLTVTVLALTTTISTVDAALAQTATVRNGLPPTCMDSFDQQAGEYAELIYGDESSTAGPPYMLFTRSHRINTGIPDIRDQGLTIVHGSWLPSAWGLDGTSWCDAGSSSGLLIFTR